METRAAPPRYEDWAVIMHDLVNKNSEERDTAFQKLNRLISKFLGQLRAWDHEESWQDLRQTVILKLVNSYRRGQLRESKAFVSYAKTITRNEFYDFLRARRGEQIVEIPEEVIESPLASNTLSLSLRDGLDKLPENHRKAIQAVYLEDQTYAAAAASTGIPLGSLKRYLRLGLAQLQAQLAGDFSER